MRDTNAMLQQRLAGVLARHVEPIFKAGTRLTILASFVGPGDKLVLRTERGDAVFVWRKFVDDCIDQRTGQRQEGVNCAIFRNEGKHISSSLIRQADAIADATWTDRRHYTYVDCQKVASSNPGYCFLKAGWRRCGHTKSGLLVLERVI